MKSRRRLVSKLALDARIERLRAEAGLAPAPG
jgi:hypothetical protein